MYIKVSGDGNDKSIDKKQDVRVTLRTPTRIALIGCSYIVEFWYNMFGGDTGTLVIKV